MAVSPSPPPRDNSGDNSSDDRITDDRLGKYGLISEQAVPVRDVRVAVTMVGGVALAIYECGVALELFRMVHGQGMYGLLKRITQSHAYIDILSGTSAGGINNVCLAAALANGTDLASLRDTWLHHAGIDDLLSLPGNSKASTLLRGDDYYTTQIFNQFEQLVQAGSHKLPVSQSPLPSGAPGDTENGTDLDLFVTGTFYEGQPGAFFDQRDKAVYTEAYNGVFHLKHRTGRQESHLNPQLPDAQGKTTKAEADRRLFVSKRLTRIARTTSSLPAVFEPSPITPEEMGGLKEVIKLPRQRKTSFMLDGGFLNNRPLDLVLSAIYRKTASREVVRKVFFVEPVAVGLVPISGDDRPAPNALQALMFYRDVPSRQSLSSALTDLGDKRVRTDQIKEMLDGIRLDAAVDEFRADFSLKPPTEPQIHLWATACLQSLRDRFRGLWNEGLGVGNVFGLETGEAVAATEEATEAQQKLLHTRRDALDKVATSLYDTMTSACRDAQPPKRPESTAPNYEAQYDAQYDTLFDLPAEGASGGSKDSWELSDVDVFLLMRLLERTRVEIREFVFPRVAIRKEKTVQGERQAIRKMVQMPLAPADAPPAARAAFMAARAVGGARDGDGLLVPDKVQEHLSDLNHLVNLCDVLQGNLLTLLEAMPETAVFQNALNAAHAEAQAVPNTAAAADPATLESAVDALWHVLYVVLSCLVFPLDNGEPLLSTREMENDDARKQELTDLYSALTARTETLCQIVRGAKDAQSVLSALQAWENEQAAAAAGAANLPQAGLIYQMNLRLNAIVWGAARDLQRPLFLRTITMGRTVRKADKAQKELQNALSQNASVAELQTKRGEAVDAKKRRDAALGQQFLLWTAPLWDVPSEDKIPFGAKNPLRHLDIYLYPVEKASDLPSLTQIDLVYISPRSEQSGLSARSTEAKLAGDALGHAGGFLKRSWRANDIMWGRLDASGAIRDTLLDSDRLERLRQADPAFGPKMLRAVEACLCSGNPIALGGTNGSSDTAKNTFAFRTNAPADKNASRQTPPAGLDEVGVVVWQEYIGGSDKAVLEAWTKIPSDTPAPVEAKKATDALLHILLFRHQLEIIAEEVPAALGEALSEYVELQGKGLTHDADTTALPFTMRGVSPERVKASLTGLSEDFPETGDTPVRRALRNESYVRARSLFAPLAGGATAATSSSAGVGAGMDVARLLSFFQNDYKIGSEDPFHDIPPLSNLQRVSQSLLVIFQILSRIADNGGLPLGKKLDKLVFTPLKTLCWVGYSFFTALAQGARVHVVLLTLAASVLFLVPLAVAFHMISANGKGTAWGMWGFALLCAIVIALFRFNKRATAAWICAAFGLLWTAQGLASTIYPWKLPLGELLLVATLILTTKLPVGGRGSRIAPYASFAFALLGLVLPGTILAIHHWFPRATHLSWLTQWEPWASQAQNTLPLAPASAALVNSTILATSLTLIFLLIQMFLSGRLQKECDIKPGEGIVALELALTGTEAAHVLNGWTRLPRATAIKEAERTQINALAKSGGLPPLQMQNAIETGCGLAAQKVARALFGEVKTGLWWDFGFAAAYGLFLAILCLWAARGFVHLPPFFAYDFRNALFHMAPAVGVLALFAGLMDFGENVFLLRLLSRAETVVSKTDGRIQEPPDEAQPGAKSRHPLGVFPTIATVFSCIKWVLVMVAVVYVVMGGLTAFNETLATTVRALVNDNGLQAAPETATKAKP